jgi:hypothetical protein
MGRALTRRERHAIADWLAAAESELTFPVAAERIPYPQTPALWLLPNLHPELSAPLALVATMMDGDSLSFRFSLPKPRRSTRNLSHLYAVDMQEPVINLDSPILQ